MLTPKMKSTKNKSPLSNNKSMIQTRVGQIKLRIGVIKYVKSSLSIATNTIIIGISSESTSTVEYRTIEE